MYKIIFEYTSRSKYAAQGAGPSGAEGYDIWIDKSDGDMIRFLGFCGLKEFDENVSYYIQNGYKVYLSENKKVRRENRKKQS